MPTPHFKVTVQTRIDKKGSPAHRACVSLIDGETRWFAHVKIPAIPPPVTPDIVASAHRWFALEIGRACRFATYNLENEKVSAADGGETIPAEEMERQIDKSLFTAEVSGCNWLRYSDNGFHLQ